ncbi:MAG: hypothetical protein LIP08_15110 [Bacteroides sp.]|nr:hypothetical protein [Bacteroides sp.]
MNTSKLILLFVSFLILSSCAQNTKNATEIPVVDLQIYQQQVDSLINEELELLQKTIVNNLKIVDNHMVFPLSEEEFTALGLPGFYYEKLQQELRETNEWIDASGLENVEEILAESYQSLYQIYGSPQE